DLEGGITPLHGPPTHIELADGIADGFYCDAGLAPFQARPELWEDLRRAAKSGARLVIHEADAPHHLAQLLDEGRPADARLTQAIVAGWQPLSVRFAVAETYRSLAAGDLEGLVRRRPEVVRNLVLHL